MVTFPPSKINLGLHILSKRPDGYHEISTCFYTLPWTDILEILPHSTLTFSQSGIAIPGSKEDNLCLRAYELLKEDFNLPPVQIHLHKIIPAGAGLGGGSSDGACGRRRVAPGRALLRSGGRTAGPGGMQRFGRLAANDLALLPLVAADFSRAAALALDVPSALRAGDALHLACAERVGRNTWQHSIPCSAATRCA